MDSLPHESTQPDLNFLHQGFRGILIAIGHLLLGIIDWFWDLFNPGEVGAAIDALEL